tara:strand:- start:1203 stop:1805 length:603 start_codon:yes stop_codon:yes gene_type:complete
MDKLTRFNEHGFFYVKEFLPSFFAEYLKNYFSIRATNDPTIKGDPQAPNSHSVYGDPAFDTVLSMSTELIERVIGKKLIPQYSYARIYKKGSVLERHCDRPECEYSVTVSLGGTYDKNWPIWCKDYLGNDLPHALEPGDCLVYHGTELEHWRDEFEGETQYQLFLHYVDADGQFKDRIFDDRPNLGLQAGSRNESKFKCN